MLIIKNANEIATCHTTDNKPSVGNQFSDCKIIKNSTIVIDGKYIAAVGNTKKIMRRFHPGKKDLVIDAINKIIIPGFVDCHTHAVFAGSRAEEYDLKLKGQSYAEIHKKRGGIYFTVTHTRKASEQELFLLAQKTLREMFFRGTTTIEIKSGYGLTIKDEIKILRTIKRLKKSCPQDIVTTFLGAHTVPVEYLSKRALYVKQIIQDMLPLVKKEVLADYCDVFCDKLGFTPKETVEILNAAKNLGMKTRVHAEQTSHWGGARIASQLHTTSTDHCDFTSFKDLQQMQKNGVTAVFLPGVLFHLMEWDKLHRLQSAVNHAKDIALPFALATDYNPGSSPILSIKLIADFAHRFFKLDYNECLNAVTLNASYALGLSNTLGSIAKGKQADLLVADAPTVRDYFYQIGDQCIDYIIKNGVVYSHRT